MPRLDALSPTGRNGWHETKHLARIGYNLEKRDHLSISLMQQIPAASALPSMSRIASVLACYVFSVGGHGSTRTDDGGTEKCGV